MGGRGAWWPAAPGQAGWNWCGAGVPAGGGVGWDPAGRPVGLGHAGRCLQMRTQLSLEGFRGVGQWICRPQPGSKQLCFSNRHAAHGVTCHWCFVLVCRECNRGPAYTLECPAYMLGVVCRVRTCAGSAAGAQHICLSAQHICWEWSAGCASLPGVQQGPSIYVRVPSIYAGSGLPGAQVCRECSRGPAYMFECPAYMLRGVCRVRKCAGSAAGAQHICSTICWECSG